MNGHVLRVQLFASCLFLAAIATAAPQYSVIDLGSTDVAGSGLAWQVTQALRAPANWPSSGGSQCYNGVSISYIYAQYGNTAVGTTCAAGIGEVAAKWTISGATATLTVLGMLPGAGSVQGPFSIAFGFNNVGDIVGMSNSSYYPPDSFQNPLHGFIYNNGKWTDLVPIGGPQFGSWANGVNDSHEVVGSTTTVSSVTGQPLDRAFVYIGGTTYNLTFYLVGGPTVRLTEALSIDCQGNIAAVGTPAAGGSTHSYLLIRQGPARTNCPK